MNISITIDGNGDCQITGRMETTNIMNISITRDGNGDCQITGRMETTNIS